MTIKTRRILYITFILAFLIAVPLITSYAAGYKFSFNQRSFQKTGLLIIDSKPRGAKIYLNNKEQKLFLRKYIKKDGGHINTPAKIKSLIPGEYNIKLELNGYWDWQKKLNIEGGETTFAENINMFKKDLPVLLNQGKFEKLYLSPDNQNLLSLSPNNTKLINLSTEEEVNIKTELNNNILWSPNNKLIIIGKEVINTDSLSENINIEKNTGENIKKIKWGKNNNEIFYIGERDNSIKSFSLSSKTKKNIINSEGVVDFLIKDNHLFVVNKIEKNTVLNIYDINSKNFIRSIDLPSLAVYSFINPEHNLINLYDEKHQSLYLIDPLSYFPLRETINNVKIAHWVDNNKLLWANDFEIWLSDINNNKKELITRISNPITEVIWHPSDNYIIYLADNTINIIELDKREKRNIIEVIKLDDISEISLNEKGDVLYFNGSIGSQKGIYKLSIQ